MSDLEKFLQQAAERMKQRMREQQAGKPPAGKPQAGRPQPSKPQAGKPQGGKQPPQRQAPVRQAERAAPRLEEPEILEAELIEPLSPSSTLQQRSEQLSSIGKRKPPVTKNVDLADERMSQHLHQVFDHNLGQLSQKPMTAVNDVSPAASRELTNQSSQVDRRQQINSPLIAVLQQPENLMAAFIVGEIFKRKF